MNRLKSLLLLIALPLVSHAYYIELYGQVIEHFSSDPLKKVYVRVYSDGAQEFFKTTKGNGAFSFKIERDKVYTVEFVKKYLVTKTVQVDTRNMPDDIDGVPFFGLELEIDLFPYLNGLDYSVFKKPLGKAKYSKPLNNFSWDKKYALQQKMAYNKFWSTYEKAFFGKPVKYEEMPKKPKNWVTPKT